MDKIPSISQLLEMQPLKQLAGTVSKSTLAAKVGAYLEPYQRRFTDSRGNFQMPSMQKLAVEISQWITGERGDANPFVINGSGRLLSPELTRAPLPEETLATLFQYARDYHLVSEPNGAGEEESVRLLRQLTGAEDALVLGSRRAAQRMAIEAFHTDKPISISRSQMGQTFDGIHLPGLFESATAQVRELGAVNQTVLGEFVSGAREVGGGVVWFEETNYEQKRSTPQPSFVDVAKACGGESIPLLCDLGLGGPRIDETHEKFAILSAQQALQHGAQGVVMAGHFLCGGPECGIVLGSREFVQRARAQADALYARASNLTLILLAASLRILASEERISDRIPLLSLATTSVENLQLRADSIAQRVSVHPGISSASAIHRTCQVLPGGAELPSVAISLQPTPEAYEAIRHSLSLAPSPVSYLEINGALVIDLRGIFPRQDTRIVDKLLDTPDAQKPHQ